MSTPGVLLVVEREARVFRRLWRGTVFTSFLIPVLFLAAMGLGLGGLVKQRTGQVDGMSYLHFVTPGLLAATAMQTAAAGSLWPVMAGTKWVRFFHGVVATPLGPDDLYGGYVVWTCIRTAMQSAAFLVVAALLGGVPSAWGVLALPWSVLTAAAFTAPLTAWAATQPNEQAFPIVFRVGIMPLFLFSGTFFPVSQLPGWLRPFSTLSPLWHGAELVRGATVGRLSLAAGAGHVAVLVVLLAVGWRWGTRTFTRALTR